MTNMTNTPNTAAQKRLSHTDCVHVRYPEGGTPDCDFTTPRKIELRQVGVGSKVMAYQMAMDGSDYRIDEVRINPDNGRVVGEGYEMDVHLRILDSDGTPTNRFGKPIYVTRMTAGDEPKEERVRWNAEFNGYNAIIALTLPQDGYYLRQLCNAPSNGSMVDINGKAPLTEPFYYISDVGQAYLEKERRYKARNRAYAAARELDDAEVPYIADLFGIKRADLSLTEVRIQLESKSQADADDFNKQVTDATEADLLFNVLFAGAQRARLVLHKDGAYHLYLEAGGKDSVPLGITLARARAVLMEREDQVALIKEAMRFDAYIDARKRRMDREAGLVTLENLDPKLLEQLRKDALASVRAETDEEGELEIKVGAATEAYRYKARIVSGVIERCEFYAPTLPDGKQGRKINLQKDHDLYASLKEKLAALHTR